MAKEYAQPFYKSKAWKKCRASYISHRQSIDGGLCETCHDRVGYIVHHNVTWITPDNINDPDITLNFNNLKYDCLICHNKEVEGEKERYYFDSNGNIQELPDYDSPP